MKTAFKILPQEAQDNPFELLVEVGWDNVSFIYYTSTPLNMRALFVYHVEKN
ncbi:MAG: hypothetical protein H7X88_02420, partial [Gloeobacteraceae cyanobacterium ES-bin-316]|nr:hypothetical protein [Ferruginibacter sp.]